MDELWRLINGYRVSQALHAVAVLEVADHLSAGPRSISELAGACSADESSLYRLLRAVASIGVLEELPDRQFRLTEMGERLRSDVPGSLAGWARFIGRPYYWRSWSRLVDAVRSGGHAFRMEHGTDVWSYRREHAEEGVIFNAAMNAVSEQVAAAVVAAHDFSRYRLVVDVGGGGGRLIAAILQGNPGLRGVLFDMPHIAVDSRRFIEGFGVADRCELVGGSFFESVPAGGDAYILKSILHDWYDEDCLRILASCRAAMTPDARLLLVEPIVEPPNQGRETKFSDLNMFVAAGGRERTLDEWRSLLERARFVLLGSAPAGGAHVIEAAPA